MLARTLFGARTSLALIAVVICSSVLVGGVIGLAAGSLGGWTDAAAMRLVEVFLVFPPLLLAILLITVLGGGLASVALTLAILWWPVYALLVRNQVAALRIRPFVEAAQASGVPPVRIMMRHLLPNAVGPLLTHAAVDASAILLVAASLSFVGLGPEPPTADWGSMINTGRQFLLSGYWWVSAVPGAAIMTTALAFALLVDALHSGT
ncbi:MAG: ABC transporter permease [Caldilineaceae bacterium]